MSASSLRLLPVGWPGSCKTSVVNMASIAFLSPDHFSNIQLFNASRLKDNSDTSKLTKVNLVDQSVTILDVPGFDRNWSKTRVRRLLEGKLKEGVPLLFEDRDTMAESDPDQIIKNRPNILMVFCPLKTSHATILQNAKIRCDAAQKTRPDDFIKEALDDLTDELSDDWWMKAPEDRGVTIKYIVESAMRRGIMIQFVVTRFHELPQFEKQQPFQSPEKVADCLEFRAVRAVLERFVYTTGRAYCLSEMVSRSLVAEIFPLLTVPADVSELVRVNPGAALPENYKATFNFTKGKLQQMWSRSTKPFKVVLKNRFHNEVVTPATIIQF